MIDSESAYMDEEERELIESIESAPIEQFKSASPDMKQQLKQAADQFQRERETKMNIRIDRDELERIKELAAQEGLKYQSFVKSVLHKYVTGQLAEKKKNAG